MNRSYSKIRHIQESNRVLEQRLLVEQPESRFGLERFGYNPNKPETLDAAAEKQRQFNQSFDPHKVAMVLGIASIFIPIVGPFISAGIGLADAGLYLKQGQPKSAALVALFSLLPGVGQVVAKIPGIKQLGVKGMNILAGKIIKNQALNATELAVADGLAANAALVQAEAGQLVKSMAQQAAPKVAEEGAKETLKSIATHGVEHAAQHAAVHATGEHPKKS